MCGKQYVRPCEQSFQIRQNPTKGEKKKADGSGSTLRPSIEHQTDQFEAGKSFTIYGGLCTWPQSGTTSRVLVNNRNYQKNGDARAYSFSFPLEALEEVVSAFRAVANILEM